MRETADVFSPHQAENVAALCQFPVCQAQRAIHCRAACYLNREFPPAVQRENVPQQRDHARHHQPEQAVNARRFQVLRIRQFLAQIHKLHRRNGKLRQHRRRRRAHCPERRNQHKIRNQVDDRARQHTVDENRVAPLRQYPLRADDVRKAN